MHSQIGAVKDLREQQMRIHMDKIAKMEAELQSTAPVKLELQQRAHSDIQQIPALVSELESLRREYQHCRYVMPFFMAVS